MRWMLAWAALFWVWVVVGLASLPAFSHGRQQGKLFGISQASLSTAVGSKEWDLFCSHAPGTGSPHPHHQGPLSCSAQVRGRAGLLTATAGKVQGQLSRSSASEASFPVCCR